MQEYRERLMKLAYYRGWQKSDAEDLSQDTICRAWEDRRFLRLRSELERRRWLRRQARTWSSRGSRQTLTSHEFNFANSVLAPEVHFEENSTKFSQAYLMERIQQAIPDQRNREIFILHVIEGMQQNEIAEFYHLSPGRISQIIAIVIAKLRRDQGLRELWYDD